MANVLIGCEFSGRVREAFRALGHNAFSCDLLPSPDNSPYHLQGDVRYALKQYNGFYFRQLGGHTKWDLFIVHPDCTHHVVSGARWFKEVPKKPKPGVFYGADRYAARERDRAFVQEMLDADVERIALENPIGTLGDVIGPPTQIIQPYFFGDQAIKTTCLWLKNLPKLERTSDLEPPTDPVARRMWQHCWNTPPSKDRRQLRSVTYPGIANAFAAQWGRLL